MRRKTRKTTKSAKVKRKSKPRRIMARRRKSSTRRRRSSGVRGITKRVTSGNIFKSGMVGKAVAGIGAATITGIALNQFAPQFSSIGKPVAALLAGGPIGAVAQVLLDGGLGTLGGFLPNSKPQEVSV